MPPEAEERAGRSALREHQNQQGTPASQTTLGRLGNDGDREPGGSLTTRQWPSWWSWELELTAHLLKRMDDRGFDELDLRRMLEHASGYTPDVVAGRFMVATRHDGRAWVAIVEPDQDNDLLVVITAYPLD